MVSRTHVSSSVKFAAVAVLGLAAAAPGFAQEPVWGDPDVSVRVATADLDLSREGDARLLIERVRRAAAMACSMGQISMQHRASCAEASAGRAIRSLNRPTLTALYDRAGPSQTVAPDAAPLAQANRRRTGS